MVAPSTRVVHCRSRYSAAARYQMGIFFYPYEVRIRELIEGEVKHLLGHPGP